MELLSDIHEEKTVKKSAIDTQQLRSRDRLSYSCTISPHFCVLSQSLLARTL
jgi:hypothetical protein